MDAIDIGTVETAEAALAQTKGAYHEERDPNLQAAFDAAKRTVADARRQWRTQEQQAGRRTGRVGGDAVREG